MEEESESNFDKDGDDKRMCFHCGAKRHWKRNFKKYLNKKAQ